MAYRRFNDNYKYSNNNYKKSYTYLYLKDEIETLLCPTIDELVDISFDDAYVFSPNREYEKILSEFYEKKQYEQYLFLTGLTGSGKTTLLKKIFKIFSYTPIIVKNTIIIPFKFDNYDSQQEFSIEVNIKRINNRIANIVLSAADLIQEKENLVNYKERIDDFIDFIKTIHKDEVYLDIDIIEDNNEIIRQLYITKKYELSMLLLKFYLLDSNNQIDNVIFIVDDIESLGYDYELKPIKKMFRMLDCMHNIPTELKGKYNTNCIISCRHYIYRELVNDAKSAREIESFSNFEELDIGGVIQLHAIIENRANKIDGFLTDTNKRNALGIIVHLIKLINDYSNNFILHLNLNNLRNSLDMLKKLVYNYTWVQREQNHDISGAFTLKDFKDFNVYFPNILRALGCNNDYVYSSKKSKIPNLISNSSRENNMIIKLLIIKFLITTNPNWDNPLNTESFFQVIDSIFDSNHTKALFKEHFCQMLHDRLILRGKDASQEDVSKITSENLFDIEEVYIPQLTSILWELLSKNSILLQMYIDDIFIPNELLKCENRTNYDNDKFELCFDCLDLIIKQENLIIKEVISYGTISNYAECFSGEPISRQIFLGLETSIKKYYSTIDEDDMLYKNIKVKMEKCNKDIEELYRLLNKK